MSASLPDIVIDTQLEVRLEGNRTLYFNHIGDEAAGIRPERRADEWRRERKIGSGGFGTVWLERSISKREQCRAVKEISCRAKTGLPNKFYHELEAIGKFSQEAVC